uniref:Reverse transcriptase Ty1/copia-type domain-containing protein n=1 Tax=Graphocephala atropunctata TaxID=36148 RepID=A0A1B6MRT3_9HEMI
MYLMTATKPDIAFAVSKASRTLETPSHDDFIQVKRILRYLKGTIECGIHYNSRENNHVLECFSVVDHAGDSTTGHSTTGVVCNFGGGVITWLRSNQVWPFQAQMCIMCSTLAKGNIFSTVQA